MPVRRGTKIRLLDFFLVPFFRGIGFFVKVLYKIVFAWWLDPRMQRAANRELLDAVHASLSFLVSQAESVSSPSSVLPFDYASVEVLWKNLMFVITQGRGELNVCVAPRKLPNELWEIEPVIAALESRHFSERDIIKNLGDVATLLRPRLELINAAFSEQEYPRTRKRL